jgi:hypothetical protein
MSNETSIFLVLISPLLIGGVVALANSNRINSITEGIESRIRRQYENGSNKQSWIYKIVFSPFLYLLVKYSD